MSTEFEPTTHLSSIPNDRWTFSTWPHNYDLVQAQMQWETNNSSTLSASNKQLKPPFLRALPLDPLPWPHRHDGTRHWHSSRNTLTGNLALHTWKLIFEFKTNLNSIRIQTTIRVNDRSSRAKREEGSTYNISSLFIHYSWNGGRAEAVCAGGKGVSLV